MKLLEAQAELIDRLEAVLGARLTARRTRRVSPGGRHPSCRLRDDLSTGTRRRPVLRFDAGSRRGARATVDRRCRTQPASGPRATFTWSRWPGTRAAASSSTPPTATCSWISSMMSLPRFGWELFAWCLLGNHLHFVVRAEPEALYRGMQRLKGVYAMRFHRRHHTSGASLQAPVRLAPDPDRGASLSFLRLHAQERGEARLRRAGGGLGVGELPHDGTACSCAAASPRLRAVRPSARTSTRTTEPTRRHARLRARERRRSAMIRVWMS